MKYKTKHIVEYVLIRIAGGLAWALPLRAALGVGWLLAWVMHFTARVKVKRTRQRIRKVFGDRLSEREVRRIAWISWRNLCFNAVEGFRFTKLTPGKIRKMPIAKVEDDLMRIRTECANGFILATPHMGNWEIAGIAGDLMGLPLFTIVRKQQNPLVNAYINKMRRSFSLEILHQESKIWKGVADRLKHGKILAILPDVRAKRNGITVDYLNGRSTVPSGVVHFAQLAGCPVYPAVVRRKGWTQHEALLLDPVWPDPSADRKEDQQRMMQAIMGAFSKEICKTPEQYFWYNSRWVLDPDK